MDMMLPREKKTLETKRKIVEAAGRLIKQYDFRYLTVKNVCEEAGVAYGSFYHHFGTKENVIYAYCKDLFEKMLEANPVPPDTKNEDFVRITIWYLLVYARFCEIMGKDIIKYIFENCGDDMFFDDHFDTLVRDVIRYAFDRGYVDLPYEERLPNVSDDVAVVYKGVVMCWFNNFHLETHRDRLCVGMEHVVHQMLGSFKNEKYFSLLGDRKYVMITDEADFDARFTVIPELES